MQNEIQKRAFHKSEKSPYHTRVPDSCLLLRVTGRSSHLNLKRMLLPTGRRSYSSEKRGVVQSCEIETKGEDFSQRLKGRRMGLSVFSMLGMAGLASGTFLVPRRANTWQQHTNLVSAVGRQDDSSVSARS